MKIDKLDLLSKGWSASEIEKTSKIIEEAEKKSHVDSASVNRSMFWVLLVILLAINFVCSIVVLPLVFAIKNYGVDFLVAIIGFFFGIIFTILIADIEKLEPKHHNTLLAVMVISGIINFGVIFNYITEYVKKTGLVLVHNGLIIGGIYLMAFLIPYAVFLIKQNQKNK